MKLIRVAAWAGSLDVLLAGQLRFLSGRYDVVGVASPDSELHDRIRSREGIRTVELPIERRIAPIRDLLSLVRLYRLFRRERPAIVHSLTPKAGLLSMTAAWAAGVRVRVHTFTGLIFPWRRGALRRVLLFTDRLTCAFATHIIPEGEGVRRDLTSHRVTRKPLRVLAGGGVNGVDTEHFKPPVTRPDDGITRFVFVGRLVRDKGVEELRAAFEGVENAELVLVGPLEQALDPLTGPTLEWAKRFGVGFQQDIRPFLAAADVLVLPSHREGFPGAPLQAGAMGLPAIVTDICGCNEIVVDGVTGLLVAPHDTKSLHDAMARLAADPALRRTMGGAARERVVENFGCERVWAALLDFYDEATNEVSKVH
ncbi:MAG: glycosyltransferase family 4 protein [Alistipes sp.]|jgi:glycosyltransferase involved in cell wall biosynthesis|nr:glycosyltransferase family 4 protein [Alistipes sp.]